MDNDYPEFLESLYRSNAGLAEASYSEQLHARTESLFGAADFYSSSFRRLGWHAVDVFPNNRILQERWAREHGAPGHSRPAAIKAVNAARWLRRFAANTPLRRLKPIAGPVITALEENDDWLIEILASQVADFAPDVILNMDLVGIGIQWLREAAPKSCLIVGQTASALPDDDVLREYDLLVSAIPNFVEHFRRLGVRAALVRLGFDPRVLSQLHPPCDVIDVSFVGSFHSVHQNRLKLLNEVSSRCNVQIWSAIPETLRRQFEDRHRGVAWGIDMYQVLSASKMTLNCHERVHGSSAVNMRLFEATGVGTLLITDAREDLREIFKLGEEVITYHTAEECVELVAYYLTHEKERAATARRGQQRTLRDHTYDSRTRELADLILRGH